MSAIREGARQAMAWLHGWTGLLLGHVLFIMCLAGTLSVFKPEIGRWMRPEATAIAEPVDAIAAAVGWLEKNASGAGGWYLSAPDERMNTVEAVYAQGADYLERALDPVTGAPVARETLGGEFFYRLHFELELPYPWGRLLASLAALFMLVAISTGIIAHRRIFRDFFTFRPRKGQRSWLDGHNALGVLSLPFHIMITFTGLLTLASLSLPWPIVANYGQDAVTMYREFAPGVVDRPAAGKKAALAPVTPMLREAERYFGGGRIGRVNIANPGDAAAVVTVLRSDADQIPYAATQISFDGATGRTLARWNEKRSALLTYDVLYGLHIVRFAPLVTRWLYFFGGSMLTLAIATGMVLWIVKRRERAPLSLANRALERLNVGVLVGVPIGLAAFFCANRLLPLGGMERADVEISMALWTAFGGLLAGLILPPALAWPALLGVLAMTCLIAPWLGGGAPWLAAAVARGDFLFVTIDATLTFCGAALALLAYDLARRRSRSATPIGTRRGRAAL